MLLTWRLLGGYLEVDWHGTHFGLLAPVKHASLVVPASESAKDVALGEVGNQDLGWNFGAE
jgi:hypothetical protein